MSFYDNDNTWSAQGRQPSWDQQQQQQQQQQPQHQPTPSRSGAGSVVSQHAEPHAFASQFEEIERATDNLMRSGKFFPGGVPPTSGRRESAAGGRGFEYGGEQQHRSGTGSRHHASASDFEGSRPGSAGLQGYYAGQRFPARQSEAEQMLQVKRRMAAQRERELRNYHQEQQYNRSESSLASHPKSRTKMSMPDVSGAKSERSMSPNTMSEEDRRELIARQHRALYGDHSNLYTGDGSGSRQQSQDPRASGGRGPSPLAFDPFSSSNQAQSGADNAVQMPPRDRSESTASPAKGPPTQQSLNMMSEAPQDNRTSTSSPGVSPPQQGQPKGAGAGVAPIGTRPPQGSGSAGALNKRSTTPLTSSSLSYGYSSADAQTSGNNKDERSTSAASNPALGGDKSVGGLGGAWGNNSGVWGKNTLGAQASVWG